jgi:cysteine desulfurase
MQNHDAKTPNSGLRVYLDHNATTPHAPLRKSKWMDFAELSGNPSSIHQDSRAPKTILREARRKVSLLLGCSPHEIIFNSGASEGNNSVLKSIHASLSSERNEFLISQVEHPSVYKTAVYLQSLGAVVHFIPVNRDGQIDLKFIEQKLSKKTALVSVMYANNETGSIFPIKKISEMAHSFGAVMHSDCVQMLGKSICEFNELNVDYATFSAHKFYALKGTGFCYVKKMSPWTPLINGGGQERGRRGGTENVIGLAALNLILDEVLVCSPKVTEMARLRDLMEKQIIEKIDNVSITAQKSERVSNTSSLIIDDVDGETLLVSLDLKNYAVSTGAACSSGNPEPSPVLLAMGLSRAEAQSSLRVSLGWETTEDQINSFVECLVQVVRKLRSINLEEKKRSHAI